jgi:hypothetical protein
VVACIKGIWWVFSGQSCGFQYPRLTASSIGGPTAAFAACRGISANIHKFIGIFSTVLPVI